MSDRARALERQGDLAGAAQAYLEHGALVEAASALAGLGRYADAARLLVAAIGPLPPRTSATQALARKASALFAAAGDAASAARLTDAALAQSSPVAQASPPPMTAAAQAAHAARRAGRHREAADAFARAGMPYEAGVCLVECGDLDLAIAHFVTVPIDSPSYRNACVHVAHACARRRALGFEADQFVGPFRQSEPRSPHDVAALYYLGILYEQEGFDDEAREALARVVRVDPNHRDAARRLGALPASRDGVEFEALAGEDLSFWRDGPAREVPDLEPSIAPRSGHRESEDRTLAPGVLVANRYRVEAEIGRGGMGIVYRARDIELDEAVALKTVDQRVEDPELVARLKQEVAVTRRIGHPNVVRVFDMGLHHALRFITMELLVGQPLKKLVGHLSLAQAIRYVAQVADALAAAHGLGVIHRDVKTANLFVTADEVIKLMDFGLAKQVDTEVGITHSGFVAGTPGYMPPEQLTGFGTVTAAADMYALGVVLYELVTGKRPFRHSNPAQIMRMQFISTAAPMRTLLPEVPERLDALVLSLLAANPAQRPRAEDVRAALEPLVVDI